VYRTYRIAVANDSKKFSSGRLDCAFTRFHCKIAKNMKRKPSPLAPKMKLTPANGSKSEERSGALKFLGSHLSRGIVESL